ncbi:hypothetical protein [Photorhabdus australis]|uniref:hypothetical protein n=1 Tax=Photorhabdus australis TaxID=286156 RepID=UPI000DA12DA0
MRSLSIPVIFQVASLLAALTHPGLIVIYTRHLSSCFFVGCTRSPRSHSYLYPSSFKLLLCWLHSLTPVT